MTRLSFSHEAEALCMASIYTVRRIRGQNFSTDDPTLESLRAMLHQTRRELARANRIYGYPTAFLDKLEQRKRDLLNACNKRKEEIDDQILVGSFA